MRPGSPGVATIADGGLSGSATGARNPGRTFRRVHRLRVSSDRPGWCTTARDLADPSAGDGCGLCMHEIPGSVAPREYTPMDHVRIEQAYTRVRRQAEELEADRQAVAELLAYARELVIRARAARAEAAELRA